MIRFENGTKVQTIGIFAGPETLRGYRRDVATITTTGIDYAQAVELFVDGAKWSIVETTEQGEQEYNWSNYGVAGSITDNRDGTLIIKMGRNNTVEQDLQDEKNAAVAQAAQYAEISATLAGKEVVTTDDANTVRKQIESTFKAATLSADESIANMNLAPDWKAGNHSVGEKYVTHSGDGLEHQWDQIWEVIQAYDNSVYPDIIPGNDSWFTFHKPYHGTTIKTARPFVKPKGAHDLYQVSEIVIWQDGFKKAKRPTDHSPDEYASDWEDVPVM